MKIFSRGPFAAIFWGGLLAGLFDLTQAFIAFSLTGSTPFRRATVYYLLSRRIRALVEYPVISGLIYGELVFMFMYWVVIPLSAIGHVRYNLATYLTGPIGHPLLIGWAIALCLRRFART